MKRGWPVWFWKIAQRNSAVFICCVIAPLCNPARAQEHAGLAHAEHAQKLMLAQQNSEAIGEWEAALKADPANPVYRNLYGLALQAVGRPADARTQFQRALQLKPGYADAHSNLAYNFWTAGEEGSAIPEFDRALKLRPSDPGLHLARGLLAASSGKLNEACKYLDLAKPWPNDAETLWRIFSAYEGCNQTQKAVDAAQLLPTDAETQLAIGRTLLALREPQPAVPFLERARDSGGSAAAILMLAEAHLSSGNPERALQDLTSLPDSDRTSVAALELRATCLVKMGKRVEAQAQFMELVGRFPENPEVYIDATQIPLEDQKWDVSLAILNNGLNRLPGNWLLLFRRAMTYKLSTRLKEARADLLEAMRHGDDVPLVAAALGEVYAAQDNLTGAAQLFRQTFGETGAPEFQFAYALALEKQGDDVEALKEMNKAALLLPSNARAHFEYGKLLRKNGQMQEARQELEHARVLDPNWSETLYVLSRLYQNLGESDRAAETLKDFYAASQKSGASPQ